MLSDEPKDAEAAGPGPDGTEAGGLGGSEEPPPQDSGAALLLGEPPPLSPLSAA